MVRNLKLFGIFLVCVLILPVSGCSKKLSEDKAKEQIINKYFNKPIQQTVIINDHGFKLYKAEGPEQDPLKYKYEALEKMGILKLSYEKFPLNDDSMMYTPEFTGKQSDRYILITRRISLTDKGKSGCSLPQVGRRLLIGA